ncbi:hypothetical protein D3C80_1539960 [compost metagenome]
MQVARIVGDGQAVSVDLDEAGAAAAMGHVHGAMLLVQIDIAGDEKGVGLGDHLGGPGVQGGGVQALSLVPGVFRDAGVFP